MPIITNDDVIRQFRLPDEIGAAQLDGAVAAAHQTLSSWLPSTAYLDAESGTPENVPRQQVLVLAAGYLAMREALPLIAARVRLDGITKAEQAEIGRVLSYLTPAEMEAMRAQYLTAAVGLAAPYTDTKADDVLPATVPVRSGGVRARAVW